MFKNWIKKTIYSLLATSSIAGATLYVGAVTDDIILSTDFMEVPMAYEIVELNNKHFFEDNETKEIITVDISKEEYLALGVKDAPQPTLDGAKWLYSGLEIPTYSDQTIPLDDYQYMVLSSSTPDELLLGASPQNETGLIKIKIPGETEKVIDKSYIKDKRLTVDGLKKIKELKDKVSFIPNFLKPNIAYGAIAFDAYSSAGTGGGASSLTYAHTVTGTDTILFVYSDNHWSFGTVSGITFNGTAMTKIVTNNFSSNHGVNLYYLVAPTGGTHNIVITKNDSTGWIQAVSGSYTGASQTGQPDAYLVQTEQTTTSYSRSLTTIADNSWIFWGITNMSGSACTAGANTTVRTSIVNFTGSTLADTGTAQTPAGSKSMTVTSTSQTFASVMASFSPASEATSTPVFYDNSLIEFN